MSKYSCWGIDQHPAPMLEQMEKQIRDGERFVSTLYWNNKFGYISQSVDVTDSNEPAIWILITKSGKRITKPMWNGDSINHPFRRTNGKNLKSECRRLIIERKAYAGTDNIEKIEDEIDSLERELGMAIDEYLEA